jgi:hypothetical protein
MSKKLILAAVAMLALSGPALACKGKTVLLEDNFEEVDPAWSVSDAVSIGSGKLSISPKPGYGNAVWYNGMLFDDADICVDMVVPTANQPDKISGGILFYFDDWDNNFRFVTSGGSAAVVRYQKGKYLTPISWREVAGMNTKPGSVNTLRLTLKGNTGTAYVNDKPLGNFKMAPGTGTLLGLVGYSAQDDAPATWTFQNLKVTDVAAAGPARPSR